MRHDHFCTGCRGPYSCDDHCNVDQGDEETKKDCIEHRNEKLETVLAEAKTLLKTVYIRDGFATCAAADANALLAAVKAAGEGE